MDGTKQMLEWTRRVERKFESSRLEPQYMATAYATVLPAAQGTAAGEAVRQAGNDAAGSEGRVLRRAMGA